VLDQKERRKVWGPLPRVGQILRLLIAFSGDVDVCLYKKTEGVWLTLPMTTGEAKAASCRRSPGLSTDFLEGRGRGWNRSEGSLRYL